MTCEPVTPVLGSGPQPISLASVGNHNTGTEVTSESSTSRQLPEQIGQYPTESDVITDLEGDTMLPPMSQRPTPILNPQQVSINKGQQFAFRNPNLKHEFHPFINGKCL